MNILIVGNGFDLSHYLPTKYDHFMDAMQEIENKKLEKPVTDLLETPLDSVADLFVKYFQFKTAVNKETYEINFNQLFVNCRDSGFISKTFDFYKVENSKLTFEQIVELQLRLAKNSWYQYFKQHVREVKTWIDFETKIDDVLCALSLSFPFFSNLNFLTKDAFSASELIKTIGRNNYNILKIFKLFERNEIYQQCEAVFCIGGEKKNGLNFNFFLSFIQKELDEFIEIFNLYLKLVIDKLEPKAQFKIEAKDWVQPDHIFSFNYTNTFRKFYESETKAKFLHGRFGEEQNIVLGVSDLEDESLKKLKAYGFTKYHQKLFKETDYLFLDKYKKKVEVHKRRIEYFEKDFGYEDPTARKFERQKIMEMESPLDLNIKIWGHSLDVSDREYILDLFSLNDDMDRRVRVVVYYYDDNAKFALLNNLLDILKKDKVEKWMKNGWLTFKENPKVELVKTIPEKTA